MNNYILAYYQQIKDGSILVSKWIRMVYDYVVQGLNDKLFFFDAKKANKAIRYIETFCHHHEGALAPQLLKLELWQKAMISCIFGLVDEKGKRQFTEIVCILARKNGKTLLASAIANYCTYADGEYGGRVCFAAPRLQQASLCFDAYYQSILHEPELDNITKKRKSDIYISETNTSAAPLAFSAKRSDGFNISLCINDEIASWQGDAGLKFYEVIRSSFGARKQPLLINISTAGYQNEGIYDELIKRSTRLLLGDSKEKKLLPFLYMIDDADKWNDINELRKSNPNLGVSVTVDYLLEEIAIAEGSYSKKSEFLTKYCNAKQNSSLAWIPSKTILEASQFDLKLDDLKKHYAVGGIDLSQTTDLTACTCVIEDNGILNVFAKFFIPAEKLDDAIKKDGIPYDKYIARGELQLSGDNYVDYKDCFAWFVSLVEQKQIYPLKVGYDRYSATYLVQDMKNYGFHMDDVFQGDNLWGVMQEFEGLLKDKRINIGDNELLKLHLLDSGVKMNIERGRGRLVKIYPNAHIDGVAALLCAMTVRQKYYAEIGEQLKNNRR